MKKNGEVNKNLPELNEKDNLKLIKSEKKQHFTLPPPRYTEASLVKKLEELGIGRPSTYASIIKVLQDRDYVILDKKRFIPHDRGRVVSIFLENYFNKYVEYDFTADLENQLDEISDGKLEWKDVIQKFWGTFKVLCDQTIGKANREIIDVIDNALGPIFFHQKVKIKIENVLRVIMAAWVSRLESLEDLLVVLIIQIANILFNLVS